MIQDLVSLKKIIKKYLPKDIKIYDITYRPVDMGVFGNKGYSVILTKKTNKMMGLCLEEPTPKQIQKGIKYIIRTWTNLEGK